MMLTHGPILHLLWLAPLVALALIVGTRKKRQALERFADKELLPRIAPMVHPGKRFIKAVLLLVSLGALVFALAGPRWGSRYQEVSRKGVDIMLAVDVSTSMMVEDIKPTRLERARREIIDFLKVATGDRIGLVAFAGAGFIQCPLTLDYAALEMFLSALQPGLIPIQGTDLGAAVDTALSAFDFKAETDKVVMLITDGEDNEERGLKAARVAAEKGVKIFVFGIGDTAGGPIPSLDGDGGFKKDKEGKLILSKLDEAGLKKIASTTGGTYVRSVVGDLDLDILYFEGIKERTEAQDLKGGKIKVYEERFAIFALLAFLALLLEGVIDDKAGSRTKSGVRSAVILALILLAPLAGPASAVAATNPDELYRAGRFEEAAEAYAQADMDNPKNLRYRYNRGCAAYQGGRFQEASAAFSSVLRRAEDDDLRFRAAYNLGNTAYKQQDLQSAADHYKKALTYNPSSQEARHNLELTLRTLEKIKQEQKRNQDSKQQPDQNQENDTSDREKSDSQKSSQEKDQKPGQNRDKENKDKQDNKTAAQQPQKENENTANQKDQPKDDSPQNLSGDLKAKNETPPQENKDQKKETEAASIDKKKAASLLENIKEDRSRFMKFMIPKDKRDGVSTGKDW